MSEFEQGMQGCLIWLGIIFFLVFVILVTKILLSIILVISYLITSFVPRLLATVLAFFIAVVVYVLIPCSLLYLSVIGFLRLEISIKGSQNRIPLLPNRVFWRGLLNRENYYRQRIAVLILLILSIISGVLLGWVTKDAILRYREELSFYKMPCGDNSSKIDQNLHQVFVNKNDEETLKYLQQNYCQYAARKYRKDKNQVSILAASFESKSKANNFAKMMILDKKIRSGEVVKRGRTCERSNNENFYPVFVNKTDAATLKYLRDNYCQDAIIQYRKDLKVLNKGNQQHILVTDFSDKAKALEFARILQADSEVNLGDIGIPGFTCHQPNNNPDKLYPVFVNKTDDATLKYIKENYCQEAKIIDRKEDRQKNTNIPSKSILVALFEDKQQALDFARYLQKDAQIRSGEQGALGLY